ncbi:MAG: VanZ family protein [Planctomycetes bacterium]|nr:VanZ family protein [Planctomycetota bacterium]
MHSNKNLVSQKQALRSGHFAWLALAFCAAAIYGSLVPFRFSPCGWTEAVGRFRAANACLSSLLSPSDFVTNVLLFVPIGFLLPATLAVDRGPRVSWLASMLVVPAALLLSVAIEFAQVYFPSRTPSVIDIMAQSVGTMIGTGLWIAAGQRLTDRARALCRHDGTQSLPARLLPAYLIGLAVYQLLPLDLTISRADLYHKFTQGQVWLVPFARVGTSGYAMKLLWSVLSLVPVGYLFAWNSRSGRRGRAGILQALALGLVVSSGVEFLHLFVGSHSTDTTRILTGTLGTLVGLFLARLGPARLTASRRRARPGESLSVPGHLEPSPATALASGLRLNDRWVRTAAVGGWMMILALTYWTPGDGGTAATPQFDAEARADTWRSRAQAITWIPLADYYVGSEFHAADEVFHKFLLFVPLGALVSAWKSGQPRRQGVISWPFVCVVLAALGIEVVQFLLPTRYPSVTDVLVQTLGGWAGIRLWRSTLTRRASDENSPAVLAHASG